MQIIEKPWGKEEVIEINDKYGKKTNNVCWKMYLRIVIIKKKLFTY